MAVKKTYPRTQRLLLGLQMLGDMVVAYLGLSLAFWIRFHTRFRSVGIEQLGMQYSTYLPILFVGTLFFIGSFAYLNLYNARHLLRPFQCLAIILRAVVFWMFVFLGVSLALKFEPKISRLFVIIACITTMFSMVAWRMVFNFWLSKSKLHDRITQRVLLIGWGSDAAMLASSIQSDPRHAYKVAGYLATKPQTIMPEITCAYLGTIEQMEDVIKSQLIDILLVADFKLGTEKLLHISTLTERHYVEFKIVPTFFRIFISNLRLQSVAGVPVLGVEELEITTHVNAILKRTLDIIGALVGLVLSGPLIAVLAILIKRESRGPIFYRQRRTGRHGHEFHIYKLRSMRLDAETRGAQWAVKDDPRRTKIGTFMRETNLDEIPQFWNVLTGDMSLVGPRPERPELIASFEKEIPHYNPRHEVRPGITGWAQVNGLRGNTSLTERIRYDLYYIENWSMLLDFRILIMTFLKQRNAY